MSEHTEQRAKKKKTGTREWSAVSKNNGHGCAHGCIYCYARAAALRFGKLRHGGAAWVDERPSPIRSTEQPRYKGVVMFPTTHDITPENMEFHLPVLWQLLAAGNHVLWVSKPHLPVVEEVLARMEREVQWWDQLDLRFTIGADDERILAAWEPGAPSFQERLACLRLAALSGLRTSVSCEPLLDPLHAPRLIERLSPHVTDDRPEGGIWIGKLNHARARCQWYLRDHPEFEATLAELEEQQTDEVIHEVSVRLGEMPDRLFQLIRWKDSYKEAITRWQATVKTRPG